MPDYQIKSLKSPIGNDVVEVEFITSNSAFKNGPQRAGNYCYSQAYRDMERAKWGGSMEGFRDRFYPDKGSDSLKISTFPRARAFRQGVGAALNYIVARKAIDALHKAGDNQVHLVISAPPGGIQKRGYEWTSQKIFDSYLVHRGTRMCDSYCTTLSMVPEWRLSRVIATDVFEWYGHKSSFQVPLELVDSSIIDELRKCTHIHLFDDHIVYGSTMEDMLLSLCGTLTALDVNPWPVISCVSWFSLRATPIQKIIENWDDKLAGICEPNSVLQHRFARSPRRALMLIDKEIEGNSPLEAEYRALQSVSVGPPPPIYEMFPITDLDSDESSFYCTVVNREISEGMTILQNSDDDIERLPIGKEILDWYYK